MNKILLFLTEHNIEVIGDTTSSTGKPAGITVNQSNDWLLIIIIIESILIFIFFLIIIIKYIKNIKKETYIRTFVPKNYLKRNILYLKGEKSFDELSIIMRIPKTTLCDIANGYIINPTYDILIKIKETFNISLDDLLFKDLSVDK